MDFEEYLICEDCGIVVHKLEFEVSHEGHNSSSFSIFANQFEYDMSRASDDVLQRYGEMISKVEQYEQEISKDIQVIDNTLKYISTMKKSVVELLRKNKQELLASYAKYQEEQVELLLFTHSHQYAELFSKRESIQQWTNLFKKELEQVANLNTIASSFRSVLSKCPQFPLLEATTPSGPVRPMVFRTKLSSKFTEMRSRQNGKFSSILQTMEKMKIKLEKLSSRIIHFRHSSKT